MKRVIQVLIDNLEDSKKLLKDFDIKSQEEKDSYYLQLYQYYTDRYSRYIQEFEKAIEILKKHEDVSTN
jgi:hypothetical protein